MNTLPLQMSPAAATRKSEEHREISERRQLAFKRAQAHSKAVYWMRRLFPFLAILCVTFYFIGGEFSINYGDMKASVKKIELSRNELKMISPRLEGHDEKAGSYLVTADTATQKADAAHIIRLDQVDGTLEHPTNGKINLTANEGVFDSRSEVLDLAGNILVTGENGLRARLEKANIIFKKQAISSDQPVYAEMNGSTIRSDRVQFDGLTSTVLFIDRVRVKLIKAPKTSDKTGK